MLDSIKFFDSLITILPFLKSYSGKVMVIKYGGAAMKSEEIKKKVLEDILLLYAFGIKPILVHGGGPVINKWLQRYSIEPKFRDGIRVTDVNTMEVVEMVLAGKVNKDLVALLNKNYTCAIGLSGKDGNLISASSLFNVVDNFVGKVDSINTEILTLLLNAGYIPVISSIASDSTGQSYNINADTAAGAIAKFVNAEKLILLTDASGIMYNINDHNTLIRSLTVTQAGRLIQEHVIFGGMIPKVECCIDALKLGVNSAHIIDGRIEHSILLEILTSNRIGSMLTL